MLFDDMTTIAVMQPYFIPYAGYFRLFSAADLFVVFDCVQFPRRGWVHRNRLPLESGAPDWLTLPLQKCARETRIDGLRFAPGAPALLRQGMQRFPLLRDALRASSPVVEGVAELGQGTVSDYLCAQLQNISALLGLSRPLIRSSSLDIPSDVHRQDRVIAIARALGATGYVNSPGGRDLYDAPSFAEHGITLQFLEPFTGPADSILALLLTRPADEVAALIRRETVLRH